MVFKEIDQLHHRVWRFVESEKESEKKKTGILLFVDFSKTFNSIHGGNMEQILLLYGLSKETIAVIPIREQK